MDVQHLVELCSAFEYNAFSSARRLASLVAFTKQSNLTAAQNEFCLLRFIAMQGLQRTALKRQRHLQNGTTWIVLQKQCCRNRATVIELQKELQGRRCRDGSFTQALPCSVEPGRRDPRIPRTRGAEALRHFSPPIISHTCRPRRAAPPETTPPRPIHTRK